MSAKKRTFKNNWGGLSPYQLWLAIGIVLKNNITVDIKTKKDHYKIEKFNGTIDFTPKTAVDSMIRKGVLRLRDSEDKFVLTPKGLDLVGEKFQRIKCRLDSESLKTEKGN